MDDASCLVPAEEFPGNEPVANEREPADRRVDPAFRSSGEDAALR